MAKKRLKRKVRFILFIFVLAILITSFLIIKKAINKKDVNSLYKTRTIRQTAKVIKEKKTNINITMVGDLLFESPFYKAIDNGYDKNEYFKEVKDYFINDDLSIGNMEVVIGNENLKVSGDGYNFCAPSYIGDLVSTLDFEVLSTANNHAFDRGIDGVYSTIDYFKNNSDILTVGTYKNNEEKQSIENKILTIKDIKFGFLSYTLGTNQIVPIEYRNQIGLYRDPNTKTMTNEYKEILTKEITELRKNVDVLIVMMHWGQEFTFTPNNEQKEMAQFLNSLGVDIIYGSHSHSIQPIDIIEGNKKTLVFYSLGNFVSHDDDIARTPQGQETFDNAYQLGLLGKINLVIDENKIIDFNNVKTELIVNYFDSNMNNFKLIPYKDYNNNYEVTHNRYNLGLTKSFIEETYNKVIDEKYR